MAIMVIKIVDKNKSELVAQAEGELKGAGFIIKDKYEADLLGVDGAKNGNGEQNYGPSVILVGEK